MEYYDKTLRELPKPFRSGHTWLKEDYMLIKERYNEGASLYELCNESGRSPHSVLAKLVELKILAVEPKTYNYTVLIKPGHLELNSKPTEKEIIMSNANIETKVFIQGKDATEMTDAQIFSLIAKLEGEQDKLSQIKNKPKKLVAAIEALTLDIEMLVEYVDGR